MIYVVTETTYDYESTTTIILKAFYEKSKAESFATSQKEELVKSYEQYLRYTEFTDNFRKNHELSKTPRPDIAAYTTTPEYKSLSQKQQREALSEYNKPYVVTMKKLGQEIEEVGKKYLEKLGLDYNKLVSTKKPDEVSYDVEEVVVE